MGEWGEFRNEAFASGVGRLKGAASNVMMNAKDLTEEQRETLAAWADEGAQLAEIQKRLAEEFGLAATYMDTRLLILDLGIELQAGEGAGEAEVVVEEPEVVSAGGVGLDAGGAPGGAGRVTVTTDQLTRPGAVVSGSVVFSDGGRARWSLDQLGRLGFEPSSPGYRPSEADLMAFEDELRRVLR